MITYVEPQRSYETLAPLIKGKVFMPNGVHERRLLEVGDFDVIPFKTVDSQIDDYLYQTAFELAGYVVGSVRGVSAALLDGPDHFIPKRCVRAAHIALHDRIVSQLRAPVVLGRLVKRHDVQIVLRPYGWGAHLGPYLRSRGARSVTLLNETKARTTDLTRIRRLPAYDYSAVDGDVLCFANLKDRQYRDAALPVMEQLPRPVIFSTYPSDHPAHYKSPGEIAEVSEYQPFMRSLIHRTEKWFGANPDNTVALLGPYIAQYLQITILSFLIYIREFAEGMARPLLEAKGVVVLPGRYIDAGLAVGLANCPTFEIQSGTISHSKRFVAPSADHVLAIEPFSRTVFEGQGVPPGKIHVVGSPKIDKDLAAVRGMTQECARSRVPVEGYVVMLAGQPLGTEMMERVAEIVMEAISWVEGGHLLIKPHPGEDEKYRVMYRALAHRLGFKGLTISDEPAPVCALASDAVCTFYSTVGLEAFSLDKPVFAVNPFGEPPPFGLAALGVAKEVTNADELFEAFYSPAEGEGLEVLKDGLATDRCVEFIRSRLRRRGPLELVRRKVRKYRQKQDVSRAG